MSKKPCLLLVFLPAIAFLLERANEPSQQLHGQPSADRALAIYVPPKGYVCYRARRVIQVDGKPDDPAWQDAPWTNAFVDIEGDVKPKPRFRTRVKMLWDEVFFYVAADLEEPHVWATLTKHDSVIFHDNDFEVFIDPNGDNHEYYEFEINALNTGWDLFLTRPYRDGGRAVNSWEIPGLKTAVHIDGTLNDPRDTDRGWSVELAFPWAVLKEAAYQPAPPKDGDHWRVNFSRVQWRHEITDGKYCKVAGKKEDNWVWSPQGAIDMHRPEKWGYVQFSTAKPGTAKFRPDPAGPARHVLHQVYYAQRDYQKKHRRWAKTLAELGLDNLRHDTLTGPPRLQTTSALYQATVEVRMADRTQRWNIRQDSKVWAD
jgi:hypothetical protein